MKDISGSFLIECKKYHQAGRFPATLDYSNANDVLASIAKEYISSYGVESFSGYFQEYQYCVNLYAAHIIIEFSASDTLQAEAIEIVKSYSYSALNEELAKQEAEWLLSNGYN